MAGTPQPAGEAEGHKGDPESSGLAPRGCLRWCHHPWGAVVLLDPGDLPAPVGSTYLRRCWQGPSRRLPRGTPSWQDRAMPLGPPAFIGVGRRMARSQVGQGPPAAFCQLRAMVTGQTWHLPCPLQVGTCCQKAPWGAWAITVMSCVSSHCGGGEHQGARGGCLWAHRWGGSGAGRAGTGAGACAEGVHPVPRPVSDLLAAGRFSLVAMKP